MNTKRELDEYEINELNKEKNLLINTDRKAITRRTKQYIQEAIEETNSTNRYVLCENIANALEANFRGKALDYQLRRMDLQTTKKILEAIDTYIYFNRNTDLTSC